MSVAVSHKKNVVLTLSSNLAAELVVCGLSVLDRNILQLKRNGFSVLGCEIRDGSTPDAVFNILARHKVAILGGGAVKNFGDDVLIFFADWQYRADFYSSLDSERPPRHTAGQAVATPTGIDVAGLLKLHPVHKVSQVLSDSLFAEIYQKSEGWITRAVNKKISFPLTRLLVNTPLTPNQMTIITFIIGLVGCLLLISSDWGIRIVGAVMLQLSSIFDGCDGEIARLKVKHSQLGAWLDTISDDVLNNVMFVCLYVGLFIQTKNIMLFKFALLTTFASLGASFFLYHFMITHNVANMTQFKLAWANTNKHQNNIGKSNWFDLIKPILKRDFVIFLVMCLVILDLRLVLIGLFVPVWGAFFLYLASFSYALVKKYE